MEEKVGEKLGKCKILLQKMCRDKKNSLATHLEKTPIGLLKDFLSILKITN
jgi:hypothetical protein